MPTKNRLLVLLQTLQKQSDSDTWLTTADLRTALKKEGHECSIRTLRRDVKALEDCGYRIKTEESDGKFTRYAYTGRAWSVPELQILVDAVSAAQFIPQDRSEALVRRLSVMAGPSHVEELRPQILVSEHVKAKNKDMIYSVRAIRKAIDRDRKISFRYLQYNMDKQQVPKHEGTPEELYVVSPYATVWNDDRYYLIGWSDKRNDLNVYRVDRMMVPKQLPNRRVPPPEGFDVRDYTDKVFQMYGGPEEHVTLKCKTEILDQIIDRFGDDIVLKETEKGFFEVTVPVRVSSTFYGWVFQFMGEMDIVGPENVKQEYKERLMEALFVVAHGL